MIIYPDSGYISTFSPGSRVDSGGSLPMSTKQPSNPSLLRRFKAFLFSDLAVEAEKSENEKKVFQRQMGSE